MNPYSPDYYANLLNTINSTTGEALPTATATPVTATPTSTASTATSPAPTSPNGGTTYQDKSNDIALQTSGLGAVDSQTAAGTSAVEQALAHLLGGYDTETAQNKQTYHNQSDTNQNNLQSNKESALLNAAQGRRGLFGTLASLGALNGSGVDLANRAVQTGANEDLSGAADNYATNQSGLDNTLATYNREDAARRQHAQDAADNNKKTVQNQGLTAKQSFYSNLANDYAAEGNSAQAKQYTDLAASLYPDIAATNVPTMSLGSESAAFTPAALANYLAGANSTVVSATPAAGVGAGKAGIPGLVADTRRKSS